jgi:hypothetical protein
MHKTRSVHLMKTLKQGFFWKDRELILIFLCLPIKLSYLRNSFPNSQNPIGGGWTPVDPTPKKISGGRGVH